MIGIGLLGAGRIGRIHGGNVAASARARLVAIADAVPAAAKAMAKAHGARADDIEGILADKAIDAVMICTPTDTHADLIERAVAAGKAVFCEKPVDLDAQRIVRCLKRVAKSRRALMIGFNRRFDPHFSALQERLAAGAIGKVEIVTITSRDPGPPPIDYVRRSGGLFRDMMIHDLDMARFLLSEDPVEIFAHGVSVIDPAIGRARDVDTATVMMRTRSGKLCQISNSRRATYGYDQRIEVHGSKGMIRAGNVRNTTVESADSGGFHADPIQNFFLERYEAAYRRELDAFLDALEAKRMPKPNGYDGLAAQRLADAATKSAKTGRPVRLGPLSRI